MIKAIEAAIENKSIRLPESMQDFVMVKTSLYAKDWNVYLKKAFGGVNSVLKYLGRYTHRVAISNNRLLSSTSSTVSFRYKDNKVNGRTKIMELDITEFIRRFLQHALPLNFYKIRYVGILAMANAQTKKAQCLSLIDAIMHIPLLEGLGAVDIIESTLKPDILQCPKCRKGRMVKIRNDS